MNGPEHYREAERLLEPVTRYYNGGQTEASILPTAEKIATAHVHALLALAAATDRDVTRVVTLYPDVEVRR